MMLHVGKDKPMTLVHAYLFQHALHSLPQMRLDISTPHYLLESDRDIPAANA